MRRRSAAGAQLTVMARQRGLEMGKVGGAANTRTNRLRHLKACSESVWRMDATTRQYRSWANVWLSFCSTRAATTAFDAHRLERVVRIPPILAQFNSASPCMHAQSS